MHDELELFAGLGGPVITSSATSEVDRVYEAWRLWCSETKRPGRGKPDRKFAKVYREQLRDYRDHEDLLDHIRGAARLPVRPRDPRDTRRLLSALSTKAGATAAIAALQADDEPVLFPRDGEDEILGTMAALEEAAGTYRQQWTERDMEAAAILIANNKDEDLTRIVKSVRLFMGQDTVLPVDVLRGQHSARNGKVSKNAKRDTYQAGRQEQEKSREILFEADAAADRMLLKGADPAKIAKFHERAPKGYWDAVLLEMENNPALKHSAIYDRMQPTWNWHPDDRKDK